MFILLEQLFGANLRQCNHISSILLEGSKSSDVVVDEVLNAFARRVVASLSSRLVGLPLMKLPIVPTHIQLLHYDDHCALHLRFKGAST